MMQGLPFSFAAVLLVAKPLLGSPSHFGASEQAAVSAEEDSITLLQVYNDVEVRKQVAREDRQRLVGASSGLLDETSSCVSYTPIDLMVGYDTQRLLGYTPPKLHCTPQDPTRGVLKSAFSQLSSVSTTLADSASGLPFAFPVIFISIFFLLLMRMLWGLVLGTPSQAGREKVDRRPEMESWNRGVLPWLYVDFVDDWVARWGHSTNSDQTRINSEDLGKLGDPEDDCERCYDRLEALWKAEVDQVGLEQASLIQVMARYITWNRILVLAFWTSLYEAFMYIGPPLAMALLIRMMDDIYLSRLQGNLVAPIDLLPASLIATCLFTGIPVGCGVANTFTAMLSMRISARVVGGLSCLVYRKAQRLPTSSQIESNDEEPVSNKEAKDKADKSRDDAKTENSDNEKEEAQKKLGAEEPDFEDIQELPDKFNLVQVVTSDINDTILQVPLQVSKAIITLPIVIFLFIALFVQIGATMILCVFFCICVTMMLIVAAGAMASQTYGFMFWSGKRLQFLEELLFNIRTVKACGWESVAEDRIEVIRGVEIERLRGYYWALGTFWTLMMQYPNVLIATSLWGYMWLNGKSQVKDIWTLLPLLYTFQSAILALLATMPTVVNAMPCIMRVQAYLKLREAPNGVPRCEEVPLWMQVWPQMDARVPKIPKSLPDVACQVRVQGNFSWMQHGEPTLRDVDLVLPAGSSLAILGKVGSGKSTLLMGMLGELYPLGDSRISVPYQMAFSAQTPYIMEGTLRENILCHNAFHQEHYNACINAACLLQDLEVLPGGEEVPIGSRGISLSGGQKARVSMARAAYSRAPLTIIDDPFSALDSRTGRHVLDHYVFGDCLKGSTRVIVTQPDAERIARFDRVLILAEGRVAVQGTPQEVIQTEEYKSLLSTQQMEALEKDGEKTKGEKGQGESAVKPSPRVKPNNSTAFQLREDEHEGRAAWDNIAYFAGIGGYWNTFVCVFGFLGVMSCNLLTNVVLQHWSTQQMLYKAHQLDHVDDGTSFFWPFLFWWMASVAVYWFVYYHGICLTLRMSKSASADTIRQLLHAPVDRFFDKTPVGRIMNRLTTDLMNIDKNCFNDITQLFSLFWQDSVPILYVHMLMPLYFSVAAVPLYLLLIFVFRRYANTMVPMRYLTQVSKSRTDTVLTEVDNSLPFIRAAQFGDFKFTEFMARLSNQITADCGTQTFVKRWAIQRLFLLIAFYMTSMVLVCIWVPGVLSFGALGLCLTNMLQICVRIEFDMEQFTKSQYQFISMNRLHEYTQLPQEQPRELEDDNKYSTFAIWLPRDSLGSLMYDVDDDSRGIVVRRRTKLGSEIILVQKPGTQDFVAPPGMTLEILKPNNEKLKKTVQWHRVVEVNAVGEDAAAMARELCKPGGKDQEQVRLHIQSGWLADGARVLIEDLTVGYGDIPRNVLHDVSLVVEPCTNVGFVGTTGCGKSTLLLCMLRILERRGGIILINDVDIATIGLQTLRTTVGLVPQDPVLMNASVRDNLDPFGSYEDSQLWQGLRMASLEEEVQKMPEQMDTMLAGEAASLSFGQRQLLCLARLAVRQPSLILLDEATSALDPKTQELVQKTVESRFPRSTLMVIAHRLETILGFDKIIVLDKGTVAESGPVKELAAIKGGIFAGMLAAKQSW